MANSIDMVVASEAIKQVENLISKLSIADAELIKISTSAREASKSVSTITTPTGLDKAITNTTTLTAKIQEQNKVINDLHSTIAKRAEQSRLAEIKLQQQREKAFDSFEKNAQKENAINVKNEGSYQRIQNSVNLLTKTYQNLAVRKQLNGTLTEKEERQLTSLSTRINTYQTALKTVDSDIQKHQRNVGNYASGFNNLGNSINQLTREAPAFANSVNTGFMALSNNFPALFDAINGIRDKNKLLVAEGKPTVSVLKSIAGAVFSWQTLLSVGVTLLTLYGGKIIEWATGLTKAEKAQRELNEELINSKSLITNESTQLQSLTAIVKDHNESSENRKLAYDEIKKTLPGLTSATYDQAISTGELTRATDLYILSLIQKNIVEAEAESIAKQQTELNKENAKSYEEHIGKVEAWLQSLQPERQRKNIENSLKAQRKAESDSQQAIIDDRKKALAKAQEDYLNTQSKLSTYITEPPKNRKEKQEKTKKEDLAHLESYIKPVGTIIDEINTEISRLTTEKIIANEDELPVVNEQLRLLIELKKQLNEVPSSAELPDVIIPNIPEAELSKLKTDWKETFDSIADSAQKAGDIIADFSDMNFKNEYARLESQKDIALKFAGESATARLAIEEQYEKKRKEIANRENKAKQKQAIFNIAIDTAQAIMATVGKTGFAGLPLALILGALGAAQIAVVASQKIPEYWQGTENAPAGLAYTNERGAEIHTDKHGNIKDLGDNKGARLTMMEQGDKVYTASETKKLLFNDDLNNMLNSKGISMNMTVNKNNGMTSQEMDIIMSKHFSKIQTNNTVFDKNGIRQWSEKNGNRTIQNANRVSRTGFKV